MGQTAFILLTMDLSEYPRKRLTFVLPCTRAWARIENLGKQETSKFCLTNSVPFSSKEGPCLKSTPVTPAFSPFLSFLSFSILAQMYLLSSLCQKPIDAFIYLTIFFHSFIHQIFSTPDLYHPLCCKLRIL